MKNPKNAPLTITTIFFSEFPVSLSLLFHPNQTNAAAKKRPFPSPTTLTADIHLYDGRKSNLNILGKTGKMPRKIEIRNTAAISLIKGCRGGVCAGSMTIRV
jgi:hypothetical protein